MYVQNFVFNPNKLSSKIQKLREVRFPAFKWGGKLRSYIVKSTPEGGLKVVLSQNGQAASDPGCRAYLCPDSVLNKDNEEILRSITQELIGSWHKVKDRVQAPRELLENFSEGEKASDCDVTELYCRVCVKRREAEGNARVLEEFLQRLN
ncbi:MAG TPA: hypothetical protein VKO42_03695 [Patescibacteria group bacterium]|nr:hypothetical protein [Patescibacteria group bacterium]